jgi:hydrogenase-1 operon protein HyaF
MHMSRLTEIPIRIEPAARSEASAVVGGLGGGVAAILCELVTLLERLVKGESPGAIDLRSLPMSPLDRAELQRVLGEGEVQATVNAQGLSKMRETRVSGVWWVEHFDQQGELIAELIEVSRVPEILSSASDEIAAGARALRAQIAMAAVPPAPQGSHVPLQ